MSSKQCFHHGHSEDELSEAAVLNKKLMRRLAKALEADPETDLTNILPRRYSSRLARGKVENNPPHEDHRQESPDEPLMPKKPVMIIKPLSGALQALLDANGCPEKPDGDQMKDVLSRVLAKSQTLLELQPPKKRVAKCSDSIKVKIMSDSHEYTEYSTLEYLEQHKPLFPAPRPHGLLLSGDLVFLFMSFAPGRTLADVWPTLDVAHKEHIRRQLDTLFIDLRTLEHPKGLPFGGVAGEGCKDTRRLTRTCKTPIYNSDDLWDFQYRRLNCSGPVFKELLHRLTRDTQATRCVFTHGDVRPDNIIVQLQANKKYLVSCLIDWEASGFYPEDFECTKTTNTLATSETDDWFLYLPHSISPARYLPKWLSDRVFDPYIA